MAIFLATRRFSEWKFVQWIWQDEFVPLIVCFQSSGQHSWRFVEIKESFYTRKKSIYIVILFCMSSRVSSCSGNVCSKQLWENVRQYHESANTAQMIALRHNKIESNMSWWAIDEAVQWIWRAFFVSAKQIIKNSLNSEADTYWILFEEIFCICMK